MAEVRVYSTQKTDALLDELKSNVDVRISTLNLPVSPRIGEVVSVLADPDTVFPDGITWDAGGEPVVTGRLLVSLIWSGSDWVGTYGLQIGEAPPGGAVEADEPTFTDLSGTTEDRYTIPDSVGVEYRKGGAVLEAGTYTPTAGEAVTITAHAKTGFSLTGTTTWSYTFTTGSLNVAPSMVLGQATITDLQVSQPFTKSDPESDPVTVTVNWGDGSAVETVTSPATHTYSASGTYNAVFTPNDGNQNGPVRNASYAVSGTIPVGTPATLLQAIQDYGALGYWKLDETSGTTIQDYSGNARHGTLAGVAGTDYVLAGRDGKIKFLTSVGRIAIPDHDAFTPDTKDLTVLAFVYQDVFTNVRPMVGKGVAGSGFAIEWQVSQQNRLIQSKITGGANIHAQSITTEMMPTARWNGVASGIKSAASGEYPTIYLNTGTPQAVSNASTGYFAGNSTAPVYIGAGFVGSMSHVAIFPWKLTDAHVQKLFDLAIAEGVMPA